VAAAIVLQLLVAVPSAVTLGPDPHSGRSAARSRADAVRAETDRNAAVLALLARRAQAVLHHDKRAFLADLDPTQQRFMAAQSAVFDHLAPVRFASWDYAVDPTEERPHSAALDKARGTWWAPDVVLRYAIDGFDRTPAQLPQGLTFVHRGDRWLLASDSDFTSTDHSTQPDIWDIGPVRVVTGRSCLVLSHPDGAGMAALALRECEAAVPRVTAVWGPRWSRRVVLLVPSTATELQRLVPDVGDVSNIAAVATAELVEATTGYHPVGDRVLVNPKSFRALGPVGRRVVLTHEVTHVASRAATGPEVPTWLVEGLADYVGFLGAGVPLRLSALELRRAMRAGHVPTALPADSAFRGGRSDLAVTYEQSWLAVTLLVRTYGIARVLQLYRDIGASGSSAVSVDFAFDKVLHTTVAAFTRSWTASLKRQLL
jgi:hypothetical protein